MNYPWSEWMDGSTWMLEHGEDFFAEVPSFRNRCHAKATSVGMQATVNVITLPARAVREAREWLAASKYRGEGPLEDASTAQVYQMIDEHYDGGWEQWLVDRDCPVPPLARVLEEPDEDWKILVRVRFYDAGATRGE